MCYFHKKIEIAVIIYYTVITVIMYNIINQCAQLVYNMYCLTFDVIVTGEVTVSEDLLQAHLRPAVVGEWCCR